MELQVGVAVGAPRSGVEPSGGGAGAVHHLRVLAPPGDGRQEDDAAFGGGEEEGGDEAGLPAGVGAGLGLDPFPVVFGDLEEVGPHDVAVVRLGDDDLGPGGVVAAVVSGH